MRYGMIMAGGSGTRLWPMSRRARPKQLLEIFDEQSLLGLAMQRLDGVIDPDKKLICASEQHREIIKSGLPSLGSDQFLGEPCGRDTLNAIGLTAAVLHHQDPEAIFLVLAADHIIEPQHEFARATQKALSLVEDDPSRMVTFGIRPTHAATGYGYVERGDSINGFEGTFAAKRFVEKPDIATAESYLASGNFDWNSGMFVFSAASFLNALAQYAPESHAGLTQIASKWDTPQRQDVLTEIYPTLPKLSVDYGIMEPVSSDDRWHICVVPMNVQWLDLGSWTSYANTLTADEHGCRANGPTVHVNSKNVLTVTDDPTHTITTIGAQDMIVIHTADATLVLPLDCDQQVKDLAQQVDPSLR
jgi:mannose-1-phosphate guanylyltransferase